MTPTIARRLRVLALALVMTGVSAPAYAQIVHGLHLGAGAFILKRRDLRAEHDVLVKNRESLLFEMNDFNSAQLFGEWVWAFGDRVELGAGAGFHSGRARSYYFGYSNPTRANSDIAQTLSLRVIPVTGVVRLLAGRPGDFQPYVGFGASALRFRYSEAGEFIDFTDLSTFEHRYMATGTALGPLVMLGLRAPVYGDVWGLTFEWRYQYGVGKTGGIPAGFLDDRIDLGGHNLNFGWLTRF